MTVLIIIPIAVFILFAYTTLDQIYHCISGIQVVDCN